MLQLDGAGVPGPDSLAVVAEIGGDCHQADERRRGDRLRNGRGDRGCEFVRGFCKIPAEGGRHVVPAPARSADFAVSAAEAGPLLPRSRHLLHVLRVHRQNVGLLDSRERRPSEYLH